MSAATRDVGLRAGSQHSFQGLVRFRETPLPRGSLSRGARTSNYGFGEVVHALTGLAGDA
jgi:hypothetical protein